MADFYSFCIWRTKKEICTELVNVCKIDFCTCNTPWYFLQCFTLLYLKFQSSWWRKVELFHVIPFWFVSFCEKEFSIRFGFQIDFWQEPRMLFHNVTFSVAPEAYGSLLQDLMTQGMIPYVITDNLQEYVKTDFIKSAMLNSTSFNNSFSLS